MNTLYRHILKNAWNIIMKFKYLWILGFFTAFLGNGGEYQILFKQIGLVANQTDSIVTWHDNLIFRQRGQRGYLPYYRFCFSGSVPFTLRCLFRRPG